MSDKITIAFIGCGSFARNFIRLFQLHPMVEKVYVCDLIAEKAEAYERQFAVEVIASFEEVLKRRDINAVAIFQNIHQRKSSL